MRKLIKKIKSSIWLYPTIYSIFAFALSIAISIVDPYLTSKLSGLIDDFYITGTGLSQSVLGIVAGSFITIATFTFSTTMVVLTMYSSQFTPRVVEDFLSNQTTMKSFGVFLSGFIYAITSLLLLSSSLAGHSIISSIVAVIYVIVGLIYFLKFVHNVSTHIQVNVLIQRLFDGASAEIERYKALIKKSTLWDETTFEKNTEKHLREDINASTEGYIQEIDFTNLKKQVKSSEHIICLEKVVGQFVTTETRIITSYHKKSNDFNEDFIQKMNECLQISYKKSEYQDFSFTIQKIVEIAIKALSPGINDPYTAIHCINSVAILLQKIVDTESGYFALNEGDTGGTVVFESYDFDLILFKAYNQVVIYGQQDVFVMLSLFKALRLIKSNATNENVVIIDKFASELVERLKNVSYTEREFEKLMHEYNSSLLI